MADTTPDRTLSHIRDMLTRLLNSNLTSIAIKDVLRVAVHGMEYYDLLLKNKSGEFKKNSLIHLMQKAIEAINIPESTKADFIKYVQSPEFSTFIDLIISAAKGKFQLKRRRKWLRRIICCGKTRAEIIPFERSVETMIDEPGVSRSESYLKRSMSSRLSNISTSTKEK